MTREPSDKHAMSHAQFKGHLWWRQVRVCCSCGECSPWVNFPQALEDGMRFSPMWFQEHQRDDG